MEPHATGVRVRYRVDGILREVMDLPRGSHAAIASRFKIMSNMDIAERRVPQDGRVQLKVEGEEIDLRVSTLPPSTERRSSAACCSGAGPWSNWSNLGFSPPTTWSFGIGRFLAPLWHYSGHGPHR